MFLFFNNLPYLRNKLSQGVLFFDVSMLLRRFLIFNLLMVLFIGTIGIPVFEHFCKIDGYEASFFVSKNHCEKEKNVSVCCSENPSNEENSSLEEKCCEHSVSFYQISQLLSEKEKSTLTKIFTQVPFLETPIFLLPVSENLTTHNASHFEDPPPIQGRDMCILFQTFLI